MIASWLQHALQRVLNHVDPSEAATPLLLDTGLTPVGAKTARNNTVQEKLIHERVIKSHEVQTLQFRGRKIVADLFSALQSDPYRLLDQKSKDRINTMPLERVICDYIAGMTDVFATRFYERLFGTRAISVFERL